MEDTFDFDPIDTRWGTRRRRPTRRNVADPHRVDDRRQGDRRLFLRRMADLDAAFLAASPTRAQRLESMAADLAQRTAPCGATYPGLWQPTSCTLRSGHDGRHADEKRSLVWSATHPG